MKRQRGGGGENAGEVGADATFGALDHAECVALLNGHHVGRIAFAFHDHVDIEPIHYVYSEGFLYGRTAPGSKLTTMQHNPWVAFEVDEVESIEWRSVVVHGTAYFLNPSGGTRDREAYEDAVERIRSFYPEALSEGDVAPHRHILFRIHANELTGRYLTSRK